MDEKFVREMSNVAVISGWVFNIICLIGLISAIFLLIALMGKGIGGFIFIFNIFALYLLLIPGRKYTEADFYKRNFKFIILYFLVYCWCFTVLNDI